MGRKNSLRFVRDYCCDISGHLIASRWKFLGTPLVPLSYFPLEIAKNSERTNNNSEHLRTDEKPHEYLRLLSNFSNYINSTRAIVIE